MISLYNDCCQWVVAVPLLVKRVTLVLLLFLILVGHTHKLVVTCLEEYHVFVGQGTWHHRLHGIPNFWSYLTQFDTGNPYTEGMPRACLQHRGNCACGYWVYLKATVMAKNFAVSSHRGPKLVWQKWSSPPAEFVWILGEETPWNSQGCWVPLNHFNMSSQYQAVDPSP